MTREQYFKNLDVPYGKIDVILDTDTYNEIDDQYAIAYMLKSEDKLNIKGFCAAPFFGNGKSASPEEGMENSYKEILKVLKLAGREDLNNIVYEGSRGYLIDENTPVESPAADFIAEQANRYSPENPLYILGIGAITNVASAILKNPNVKENCVLVWLGGHTMNMPRAASEFNMMQDIAASRIVFRCGIPIIQIPAVGVTSHLITSKHELKYWLEGKNSLCDYLYQNTVETAESYAKGKPWTRVIWDIAGVAWLLNEANRFMQDMITHAPIPEYDHQMSCDPRKNLIKSVWLINRDAIFEDMFNKLAN